MEEEKINQEETQKIESKPIEEKDPVPEPKPAPIAKPPVIKQTSGKPKKERQYEFMVGQLLFAVLVGIFLALASGYMLGKEVGVSKTINDIVVDKPAYCAVDKSGGKIEVSCNELTNVTLDSLCSWVSPELKDKIRIMIIN